MWLFVDVQLQPFQSMGPANSCMQFLWHLDYARFVAEFDLQQAVSCWPRGHESIGKETCRRKHLSCASRHLPDNDLRVLQGISMCKLDFLDLLIVRFACKCGLQQHCNTWLLYQHSGKHSVFVWMDILSMPQRDTNCAIQPMCRIRFVYVCSANLLSDQAAVGWKP